VLTAIYYKYKKNLYTVVVIHTVIMVITNPAIFIQKSTCNVKFTMNDKRCHKHRKLRKIEKSSE